MVDIAAVTEDAWVLEKIFPTFKTFASEEYLIRLTMLTAYHGFLKLDSVSDRFRAESIAQLIQGTVDKVPNIRLRAAQIFHNLQSYSHLGEIKDQIQDGINTLQGDKDKDVRYFATHVMRIK
jgi:hypothetical protein